MTTKGCQAIYEDDKLDNFGDPQFWKCGRDVVTNTEHCPKHLAEEVAEKRRSYEATVAGLPRMHAQIVALEEALEAYEHAAST